MVGEQREQRDAEHRRDEEQEEDVELDEAGQLVRPELEEVVERAAGRPQAHRERVAQEEDEVLVVRERHAVVHPVWSVGFGK